jgi:hypothetical protein
LLKRLFFARRLSAFTVALLLLAVFVYTTPVHASFASNSQISNGQGFLQGEFAEVGVRANGAFGSTNVPTGFHQNVTNCLGFRVDRAFDGWGNPASTDDGDFFCPGSPFEGWQFKVGSNLAKNDNSQTGVSGAVSNLETSGSSQCVSWASATAYNGVTINQRYCVPTDGQALHTDVTIENTSDSTISDIYFGRGFDPDDFTGSGTLPSCNGASADTNMFQSCNAVTGQGTEAQATARWGNGAFIALQSFDARARVARQTGGFSSPDPSTIWTAGDTSANSGTYRGDIGEFTADAGLYVALKVPTLGSGSSTSFRISYVLSAEGNKAPVLGAPISSGISQTVAHVSSTVNPKGFSTTANLVYSTSSIFSSPTTVSLGTFTGSDEVTFDADMTGLTPSTTYYAKVIAENEKGTTESAVFNFTTLDASSPTVSSEDPTISVDDGPVTLKGTLNPNGYEATASFQYSTTPDFSGSITTIPLSGTYTGTSTQTVSTVVSGLGLSTTYYFRLKVTNASGSAYGSTISFVNADLVAPVGIVVTSLTDDGSNGTLRWAINQANATVGGIYDTIIIPEGTITLTSDLPSITDNLTINGSGLTTTIIDGNNLYRSIYNNGSRAITLQDLTFKQGKNATGGIIWTDRGTFNVNRVKFTTSQGYAWHQRNGTVSRFDACEFTYLNGGLNSDYGSTPSTKSLDESAYTNRIYVNDSLFSNNGTAVGTERFVKVNGSTFTNNGDALRLNGLNRQQVLNSTFTDNGIGVATFSWMPTSWVPGVDNQLVEGNTFTRNTVAINFNNYFSNGSKTYGGNGVNSWSTARNNTFDANGTNVSGDYGMVEDSNTVVTTTTTTTSTTTTTTTSTTTSTTEPYYETTTTTIPALSPTTTVPVPVSPEIVEVPTGTTLPDTPTESTPVTPPLEIPAEVETDPIPTLTIPISLPDSTIPESKTVEIDEIVEKGEPVTTKELDKILDKAFTEDSSPGELSKVLDGLLDAELTPKQFDAVLDASLGSLDSPTSDVGAVITSFLDADLSDKEFGKVLDAVFTKDASPEVFSEALTTMIGADLSDKEFAKVLDSAFSEDTSAKNMVSALDSILDSPVSAKDLDKVMDAVFDKDISVADTKEVLGDLLQTDLSQSETRAVFDSVFDDDLSDKETIDLIVDVLKDGLTAENLGDALGAVFDEEVSTEVLVETFTAVLGNELDAKSLGVIVDVLESDSITKEQVSTVVSLVIDQEGGIPSEQAAELATSPKVLESINGEQATEVFDAITVAEVSQEEGAEIVEALTGASSDVKESFEEEINVFAGVFDTYVALGSEINVGDRRTVIAVGSVVAAVGVAGALGGGGSPSSGGRTPSGGSGAPSNQNTATRKEDEQEASGEIAGDGLDWISQLSIFRYTNGVKILDGGLFMKKLIYGVMNLGFTISGCLVVYLTLSGNLQRIAGISSVVALLCALYLHMREPDND